MLLRSIFTGPIAALLPKLTADNVSKATMIAGIPEDIRGYGHVKERHLKAAKEKEAALLQAFNASSQGKNTSSQHAA